MNKLTTAEMLKAYTIRKLGGGVIEVEITPEQMEDRLDDVLQMYNKYHMEGYTSSFYILPVQAGTSLYTLDDNIISVTYIIPRINEILSEPSFSIQWEYLNEKRWIGDIDLVGFELLMEKMKMIDVKFRLMDGFTFNQTTHQFQVFRQLDETENWALKVYKSNDPYDFPDIFNDEFVKEYFYALCSIQWGQNLTKYTGVPLPGGATLNASRILEDGKKEKERLEDLLIKKFSEPIDIMFG
jgi:hypothetical protein